MTDYAEILAAQPVAIPNGTDPLKASGVAALKPGADLGDVADALRRLVPLLPADALERRVIRNRAIAALKDLRIADAAGLVDASMPGNATGTDAMQGQAVAFADPEPWPEPVEGAELLNRLCRFIARFLGLPAGADVLLAVFALYTYCADAFAAAPYIVAHSPAPQCGKTRLLEVLALLVRRAWLTIVPSTAVLFRVLQQHEPVLLLDEAEVVRGRGDSAQDVRALLQSGYRRGAFVPRCVGDANEVRNFRVFGAKVFALIGELPAALFDRCIPVEMQRRPRGQDLPRFRPRQAEPEALILRRMARRWAAEHHDELVAVEVPALDFMDERAEEVWQPLVAIGMIAGAEWAERLTAAAKMLSGGRVTTSAGVELLADIRTVFDMRGVERLTSADLASALADLEGHRWTDWSHGKGLTATGLARLLKPFEVAPTSDGVNRGYKRDTFTTVWDQYLNPSIHQEASDGAEKSPTSNRQSDGSSNRQSDGSQQAENPHEDCAADALTVQVHTAPPGAGDAWEPEEARA
jgi:putative DNA primase/helicase